MKNLFKKDFSIGIICILTFISLGLVSCKSNTEKQIIGCWENEEEMDDEWSVKTFVKFKDDDYFETGFFFYNEYVVGYYNAKGKWSVYKDRGIKIIYDLSSLDLKLEGFDDQDLKKTLLEACRKDNNYVEIDGKPYNVEIISLNAQSKKLKGRKEPSESGEMVLRENLWMDDLNTTTYKKVNKHPYDAEMFHLELQLKNYKSNLSNSYSSEDEELMLVDDGYYDLTGTIGDITMSMELEIHDMMGYNAQGTIEYSNQPGRKYGFNGDYNKNGELILTEYLENGGDSKITGKFNGIFARRGNKLQYEGTLRDNDKSWEFRLKGNI
ncbi:MAG: hypothetical protein K2N08_06365 [Muribaculaceae bacterium]|nr:hypothetical protein [Muribaculaceae bacterium]